jgi:predicted permease
MARKYWPNDDPIGKRINTGNPQTSPWRTIVGIVGDIKNQGLEAEPYPQMYAPYAQYPQRSLALVVRTASDPGSFIPAVREQVWEIDRDLPLYKIRNMGQILAASIARPRFNMLLIVIFAAVALVLASVGIYGVISYSVTQRTHEIGIRMALGAQRKDVLKLVVGQGLALTLAGVGIGLITSFALTRVMSSLLYGVSATDPITFAAISTLLTGVALLACFIPARRATKVDPMIALRYE